jgi:hypothetical protein
MQVHNEFLDCVRLVALEAVSSAVTIEDQEARPGGQFLINKLTRSLRPWKVHH